MPELPDISVYVTCLRQLLVGEVLVECRLNSAFLLRSVELPVGTLQGRQLVEVTRLGKRIVFGFDGEHFAVLHLMIAGRLWWVPAAGQSKPPRQPLCAWTFAPGTLYLTEVSKKKRASLYVVQGRDALLAMQRPGLELATSTHASFAARLRSARHTVKRALTDPDLFDGIGNAYSDEILHAARLSPFQLTTALTDDEVQRLWVAAREVLETWTARLLAEAGTFPARVTAFHPAMRVHGKYGQACPDCGHLVQRVIYAESEANYCAACQTEGRVLADRSLSRLMHEDWPKTIEALEAARPGLTPQKRRG